MKTKILGLAICLLAMTMVLCHPVKATTKTIRVEWQFGNYYHSAYSMYLGFDGWEDENMTILHEGSLHLRDYDTGRIVRVWDPTWWYTADIFGLPITYNSSEYIILDSYKVDTNLFNHTTHPATLTYFCAWDIHFVGPDYSNLDAYYTATFDLNEKKAYADSISSTRLFLKIKPSLDAPTFPGYYFDVMMLVYLRPKCVDFRSPSNLWTPDGKVNLADTYTVSKSYGMHRGDPGWTEYQEWVLDFNFDGAIDLKDYYIVSSSYGWFA